MKDSEPHYQEPFLGWGSKIAALAPFIPCVSLLSDSIICDSLIPPATGLMALSVGLRRSDRISAKGDCGLHTCFVCSHSHAEASNV